jgi:crotonobetainyl-CoA:carnitine CoA-transferase CaiB-like acyl-CoA transferase
MVGWASTGIQMGAFEATLSSPIQVRGVTKVSAKRAPSLGEHNKEVFAQLGFSASEIDALQASGAVPIAAQHATTAGS